MNHIANDILMHYGMPRRSGRYPWGSGKDPYQHTEDFLARYETDIKNGLTQKDIAEAMGLSTTQLRTQLSLAKAERRADLVATAESLRAHGYSLNEIAEKMGYENDSSVRALLNTKTKENTLAAQTTAEYLKKLVDEKGMIDVGTGVEKELGNISKEKLRQALYILELEGYPTYGGGVPQATNPGKQTNLKVLCPPGTPHKDIYNFDDIHSVSESDLILTENGGEIRRKFEYPASLDSKRLQINYAEDGGLQKDGVLELRRGVKDLDLGEAHYAQVRILVDGTHYLKGMAVYADDLPDGVDIRFNTNKKRGTPMEKVLKPISNNPDNPFNSLIKENGGQSYYDDPNGKYVNREGVRQSLSLINKRAEEGEWRDWSDTLPSQFLSKQSMNLINKQLNLALSDKVSEFDEIKSLTNPAVKRSMLMSFADDCDASAVHLKAAALPRQKYQVILPLTTIKDTEVYAPNYKNGETVALIRYPHGGTFEIPILKVNNKQAEGKRVLGTAPKDAIGISKAVADRLSGADFDGDTVMVIPTNSKVKISSQPARESLQSFDTKMYGPAKTTVDKDGTEHYYNASGKEYKRMRNTQTEMGKISNLITDMTIKGANIKEIERAVKHSMVVIDAEKHCLDYKQSYKDNGIDELKKTWQGRVENGKYREGASTLISRSKGEVSVLKRQGTPRINQKGKEWYDPSKPEGSLIYKTAKDLTYVDKKTGKTVTRTQKSTQMAETDDAHTLSSGNPKEEAYAKYANTLKSLANQARKEAISTGRLKYEPSAKITYAPEVSSLDAKLLLAEKNAPRERKAQLIANSVVDAKKKEYPDMTKAEIKKESQRALTVAREQVGAKRNPIDFTDREWEAIQAGAVSDSKLTRMLKYADTDKLRQLATPRENKGLSAAKVSKISAMKTSGYSLSEIAEAIGVSTSTVSKYL